MIPELNREYPELDDPEVFEQMVKLTVGHMELVDGRLRRAQHAKATGCVTAEFRVADIATEQADGIGEVRIKLGVVLDQGRYGGLVGHRRPERAKSEPAERTPLDKAECSRGDEQSFGRIHRQPEIG